MRGERMGEEETGGEGRSQAIRRLMVLPTALEKQLICNQQRKDPVLMNLT